MSLPIYTSYRREMWGIHNREIPKGYAHGGAARKASMKEETKERNINTNE